MTSRDLKNLGIDLTQVQNQSNERPQRTRKEVNYNLNKPRKNTKQPTPKFKMPDTPETPDNTEGPNNSQKDAKVEVSLQTDPNLQGLSESQLAYVNTLITSQMMKVASSMRVVPMNPSINIPIYDEANMASDTWRTWLSETTVS